MKTISFNQGRPLPMGQPWQSEQSPPSVHKICHTPDHDASTTLRRHNWNVICATPAYFQLYRDLQHHATVLRINVWPGGDRLFDAQGKGPTQRRALYSIYFAWQVFPYLFSRVDILWYVHDHRLPKRVVARFYGVFCHLVVTIHGISYFHLVGSMWCHLVGTIHTCSVFIWYDSCDLTSTVRATDQIRPSRCVHQSVPGTNGALM
jgi:hypothetical protein